MVFSFFGSTLFSMYVLDVNSFFMIVCCMYTYSCIYVYVIAEMGSYAYVCDMYGCCVVLA